MNTIIELKQKEISYISGGHENHSYKEMATEYLNTGRGYLNQGLELAKNNIEIALSNVLALGLTLGLILGCCCCRKAATKAKTS